MQFDVFAHDGDFHLPVQRMDARAEVLPGGKVGLFGGKAQLLADDVVQARLVQHQRDFIQAAQRAVFDDAARRDVAKGGQLLQHAVLERFVAAGNDDVGHDAHALQFAHAVLGGFGLVLARALQPRHQHDVHKHAVAALFLRDLAQRFQKRLALDIADGAAHLGDDDVGARVIAQAIDKLLDLVGDMGDDLHRAAQVVARALFVQHVPVHAPARQVGQLVQVLVDEPLIVAEVEVGLDAVLGHKDLAVLVGAHGTGVDV